MFKKKILARIEEQGLEPLHRILKDLGGWPVLMKDAWVEDDFNWKESVYKFRKVGYSIDYFIDFSIGIDLKNNTRRILDVSFDEQFYKNFFFFIGIVHLLV